MARAPIANTRPLAEQKIHTGKKEPKMLYSGACPHPTNDSVKDKAASWRNEEVRRRSRSVDLIIVRGPQIYRKQGLSISPGLSMRPGFSSPHGQVKTSIICASKRKGNETASALMIPAISGDPG
ncbi:MAG: hypothetical protein WBV28_03475 [Terracidiphilus sp.]